MTTQTSWDQDGFKRLDLISFIKVWFVRIAILMKLKFFREAEIELKQFENFEKPCFFYESYSSQYPERKGEKQHTTRFPTQAEI